MEIFHEKNPLSAGSPPARAEPGASIPKLTQVRSPPLSALSLLSGGAASVRARSEGSGRPRPLRAGVGAGLVDWA